MRVELMDEVEEFIRRGRLWHEPALRQLVERLEQESVLTADPLPRQLGGTLRSLLLRLGIGRVPPRLASEVEGIVYPRLWKVMEAVRDGMPDPEIRVRIEVFNRRLSRTFASER
ncbi:MAG: hypothetical protein ACYDAD_06640 [Acidimicrobiales bacterium]